MIMARKAIDFANPAPSAKKPRHSISLSPSPLSPSQVETTDSKATINAIVTSLSPRPTRSNCFQGEITDGETVLPLEKEFTQTCLNRWAGSSLEKTTVLHSTLDLISILKEHGTRTDTRLGLIVCRGILKEHVTRTDTRLGLIVCRGKKIKMFTQHAVVEHARAHTHTHTHTHTR